MRDLLICPSSVWEKKFQKISKSHKIVDVKNKKSTLIFPRCATHTDLLCESFCKDCNIPLCQRCVISNDTHKNHQLFIITDIFWSRKNDIHNYFDELIETIIPTYQFIDANVQFRVRQLELVYDNFKEAITKHGEDWHKEVDKCVDELRSSVQEMKTKHINALKEHLQSISERLRKAKDDTQQCKTLMESNDVSLCLNYTSSNEEHRELPHKPVGIFPVFTPFQIISSKFQDLFGNLTSLTFKQETGGYIMNSKQNLLKVSSSPKIKSLANKPKFYTSDIKRFHDSLSNLENNSNRMGLFNDDVIREIWINKNKIKLFNNNQISLVRSIITKTPSRINDVVVTNDGKLACIVYTESITSIYIYMKNEKEEKMMVRQTNCRLCDMYSTSSGDVLVIMECVDEQQTKVVKYAYSDVIQTIQSDDKNKPLYSFGGCKYIGENGNFDICVTDCKARAIVVVNQAGRLRFRYYGHSPALRNNAPFQPKGICTDSQSHILTCDYSNMCIHIIDQDGQCLSYINCKNSSIKIGFKFFAGFKFSPMGLCVDGDDSLFVHDFGRNIYQCNYLKKIHI